MRIARLRELPPNFDAFVEEIAEGLGGLYGPSAAETYRRVAPKEILMTIRHSSVDTLGAWEDGRAVGLLFAYARHGAGQVPFIHVLKEARGAGAEAGLVRECVSTLRAGGVGGITFECVTFCHLALEDTFAELGFEHIERCIMMAPLSAPGLQADGPPLSETCPPERFTDAAEVILAAYEGHPGQRLHVEVRETEAVLPFIEGVAAGDFGTFHPEYLRTVGAEPCAGAIIACEMAPEVGFVLQVAVRPGHQGRGVGSGMLRDIASVFRTNGLDRMALGVTLSNPARRLYERLGFRVVHPVDAYVWERPAG